ncbi:NAD-glutamate dehydrogenase [Emcibacter sp. SYSU 3D8]|uniref:NAD-glutamate dehydrogenase n=1 Tax=Emcibacter sp. SYSU 3D8 TaxID=3133969 RepID=UPI0031FECC67
MDNRWDRKQQHLDRIGDLARDGLDDAEAAPFLDFMSRFFAGVTPEDLLDRRPESLFALALSLWRFAATRAPGVAKVQAFNPSMEESGWQDRHTVVEIVNDDMPFLVDSVTAELARQGREITLLVHPVITVERDVAGQRTPNGLGYMESYIYLEIDQQTSPESIQAIETGVSAVLADARTTFEDWQPMLARLRAAIDDLQARPGPAPKEEVQEAVDFLNWLADDNFTFLGFREYDFADRNGEWHAITDPQEGLGLIRDPEFPMLREHGADSLLPRTARAFLDHPVPLIIGKAHQRSTVHRPVQLDYVGVKRYDDDGKLIGERRFIGMFTSLAYTMSPKSIPVLRRKAAIVTQRAGFSRYSHDGKIFANILHAYPRDELFQIEPDELYETAIGILRLLERPHAKSFIRMDPYGGFASVQVFIPKDAFTDDRRRRIAALFADALGGEIASENLQIGDSPLARLHLLVSLAPGPMPKVEVDDLDDQVTQIIRTWRDQLKDSLRDHFGDERGNLLWNRYADGVSLAYCDAYEPELAVHDIEKLDQLTGPESRGFNVYRRVGDHANVLRVKIYHASHLVPLSDVLPKLENLGLRVMEEQAYPVSPSGEDREAWIHDILLQDAAGTEHRLRSVKQPLEEALVEMWDGSVEDDSLNQLMLHTDLGWRQIVVLRAYLKYMRQAGTNFTQTYLRKSLTANPEIVGNLVALFAARFDPAADHSEAGAIARRIELQLEAVQSLDEDRIIRRIVNLIRSTLRTNYYQLGTDGKHKPYLSLKLDSQMVEGLPKPRPMVEVFVYAPWTEGVHLRGGNVARGGIRWSDRPEDFRTEILGLMKAQMVKNSVIVPDGAKGGFVPKRLPEAGTREEIQAEGIRCYRTLMAGLLDITDNIVGGQVVPPDHVVRYDEDDPYLVVAADKGTASFSDIANEISVQYGFWLGDAFASGGSNGYDHKKMGITARGAWISVQRHFRELGIDVQTQPVSVVGIGDMSGDVFGNGLLLSRAVKLVAAFDHRHVFIDPAPDPETSFEERRRLFDLPRSSWADYNAALISEGGGIFARSVKAIALTPQIKALTGLDADTATPAELIHALLKADADLLWVGGIGTYVKASDETSSEVGDRANDTIRINGRDLRFKVVGEGGNLGFTQRGRIEYAQKGGRLNTDAVDNSAGVNCSDYEVNIKILLNAVVADGDMTGKQRNALLVEMTGDVASLVLATNYRQTETLSTTVARAAEQLDAQARFMHRLEHEGSLERPVEFLPDDEEIARRHATGEGLTRPELAVLMAYAKNSLKRRLARSDLPDDPWICNDLIAYFPPAMRERFTDRIKEHQLRRNIIAMTVGNEIVNRAGITFVTRVAEESGAPVDQIATAYIVAREVMGLQALWDDIDRLDNTVPADVQTGMIIEVKELLHRMSSWFLTHLGLPLDIRTVVERFQPGVQALLASKALLELSSGDAIAEQVSLLAAKGVPADLAHRIASLEPMLSAPDIVLLKERDTVPLDEIASAYFAVGARTGLDWLRGATDMVVTSDHWDRLALGSIVDDLYDQQRELTGMALAEGGLEPWADHHAKALDRARELIAEMQSSGSITVGKLGYVARQIRGVFASI